MKENEFDIRVRNLLLDATEEVSPKVWEGVAAGLDRKRRVIAMRWWGGLAGIAAVAAAIAGILFVHPPQAPEHSNPISIAEAQAPVTVEESLPVTAPVPETIEHQLAARPSRVAQAIPVSPETVSVEETAPAEVEEEETVVVEEEQKPSPKPKEKQVTPEVSEDQALLSLLAYEDDRQQGRDQGFSLSVSGNMQDNRRGVVPANIQRPYAAPLVSAVVGIYNEDTDSFRLPFSAGIGVKYNFSDRWAIGVDVRYTNLGRTFVGDYVGEGFRFLQTDIDNHQHWLGFPVHGYYQVLNRGPWRMHAFVGAGVEFLLDNDYLVHGLNRDLHYHAGHARPQWSGDIGVGVEYRVTPFLGIYMDPSLRYYFSTEWEPRSVRTVQPLRFDLEIGLRFSLGK